MKAMKAARDPRVWKGWVVRFPEDADGPELYEGQQGERGGLRAIPSVYPTRKVYGTSDGEFVRVEIREILTRSKRGGKR